MPFMASVIFLLEDQENVFFRIFTNDFLGFGVVTFSSPSPKCFFAREVEEENWLWTAWSLLLSQEKLLSACMCRAHTHTHELGLGCQRSERDFFFDDSRTRLRQPEAQMVEEECGEWKRDEQLLKLPPSFYQLMNVSVKFLRRLMKPPA